MNGLPRFRTASRTPPGVRDASRAPPARVWRTPVPGRQTLPARPGPRRAGAQQRIVIARGPAGAGGPAPCRSAEAGPLRRVERSHQHHVTGGHCAPLGTHHRDSGFVQASRAPDGAGEDVRRHAAQLEAPAAPGAHVAVDAKHPLELLLPPRSVPGRTVDRRRRDHVLPPCRVPRQRPQSPCCTPPAITMAKVPRCPWRVGG